MKKEAQAALEADRAEAPAEQKNRMLTEGKRVPTMETTVEASSGRRKKWASRRRRQWKPTAAEGKNVPAEGGDSGS